MSEIARTGKVWLLKNIPFDKSYNHTKYFSDVTTQHNWICHNDHIIGTSNPKENQNYIKNPLQGSIKLQARQENYLGCSYICFQNTSIDGTLPQAHTYNYAFVDDVRFVNVNVLEIDYTIDVFQTYLFQGGCSVTKDKDDDTTPIKQFIERTHTQTDVLGEHLEPEPLSVGNMVLKNHRVGFTPTLATWKLLVYTTLSVADAFKPDMGAFYEDLGHNVSLGMGIRAGIFQGLYCNVFETADVFPDLMNALYLGLDEEVNSADPNEPDRDMCEKRTNAFINSIVCIVAVPDIKNTQGNSVIQYADLAGSVAYHSDEGYTRRFDNDLHMGELAVNSAHSTSWYLPKSLYTGDIDGFTPKNKKLFTSPYNYIHITDGDAGQQDYPIEYITSTEHDESDHYKFLIDIAIQPTPQIICVPYGFPKQPIGNKGIEYRVTIADLPQYSWMSDSYLQWLGNSRMSTITSAITSGMKTIGGAVIGGIVGGSPIGGAAAGVLGALGQGFSTLAGLSDDRSNAYASPDSTHISSPGALAVTNEKTFHAYQKCVNELDGKRIDNFFTTYGYAVNGVDQIKFTNNRFNQHYVKTKNCIVTGGAPATVKDTIANAFNKGITFWKNKVGDYSDIWDVI